LAVGPRCGADGVTRKCVGAVRLPSRSFFRASLVIKGEVLLQQAGDRSAAAAEDCFDQAGEMTREEGALFWELRVALSLARLLRGQGRSADAMGVLQPVYDRFTEGFETADLRSARALLNTWRAVPSR
jgi:predicted ATPase